MIEVIKKAIKEAKKHHIHHYIFICSIEDYLEVKAICKDKFPQIRVIWSDAVSKGKIYLWDEPEKAIEYSDEVDKEVENGI